MPKQIVVENAIPCPFCGCEKIVLKQVTQGVGDKRRALSLRCSSSKCGINGPQVFTDWVNGDVKGHFHTILDEAVAREGLIEKATERWNTRISVKGTK